MGENVRLHDLFSMREKMDRMLSDREAAIRNQRPQREVSTWKPVADIFESSERLVFRVELPGMTTEDFSLTVENRDLVLQGERPLPEETEHSEQLQGERDYGPFKWSFRLPENVQAKQVSAWLRNGLLEIVIPKDHGSTPPSDKSEQPEMEVD